MVNIKVLIEKFDHNLYLFGVNKVSNKRLKPSLL